MLNFLAKLNSLPWLRPALAAVTALATLLKTATPPYTQAHKVADWLLVAALPLAAGSIGQSNSGITKDLSGPDGKMTLTEIPTPNSDSVKTVADLPTGAR